MGSSQSRDYGCAYVCVCVCARVIDHCAEKSGRVDVFFCVLSYTYYIFLFENQ